MIVIRNAVAEDCIRIRPLQKEIAELHRAGRPDLFREAPRYFQQEAFDQRLKDSNHTVLIAEKDGIVVGYAFGWIISYKNHDTYLNFHAFYIDDICVLKRYQRMGIGKMLFEHCVETAKIHGCKKIDLGVWTFNQDAIAFYESCGMRERARRMEFMLEE